LKALPVDVSCAVTIGNHVTWLPKSERWRIEVMEPPAMKAVFISHVALVRITVVNGSNSDEVAGLVQIHRVEIEEAIAIAEMQNWPDKLGILPEGLNGFYER
jgi:hypothetical protein